MGRLDTLCIHVQLLQRYGPGLGPALMTGEEPPVWFIDVDDGIGYYTVDSMSGSLRHHAI